MSFPSGTGARKDTLTEAWSTSRNWASQIKARAQNLRDRTASGPTSAKEILDFATYLADATDAFNRAKAVPGLLAYARNQLNDNTIDIDAEFTAMQNAVTACRNWITANFPADGNGWLLFISFDVNGRFTFRTLTTGATAGLRTQLDLLTGAID